MRMASLVAILLLSAASTAYAQFGQAGLNKIQYTDFDWQVLESEHFELYFYPEEDTLAQVALRMAEAGYDRISTRFRHEVARRIPLIIYSSHQDFQQTNVTFGFLPEGVGGFTEFLKGRVALPFNGNYHDFEHVIVHELVHVFQLSRMSEAYRLHYHSRFAAPPLWFTEGMAEHWSGPWDATGELFVRDMVLSGTLPSIDELWRYSGTFVIYKIGQDLVRFLEATYGPDLVPALYDELWRVNVFEEALAAVTGASLQHLTEAWHYDLKRRYYPDVQEEKPLSLAARPLATRGGANFQATVPPPESGLDPHTIYFMSPRSGYMDIYRASSRREEDDVQRLIKGQRDAEYESLHGFHSGPRINRHGQMAFVAKSHERDNLYLYDLHEGELDGRWQFQDLIALRAPAFRPDGRAVAFAGLSRAGQQDIYIFDFDSERLFTLTHDRYDDDSPAWSPDGAVIAFSSDRCADGERGAKNLVLADVTTGVLTQITEGPWKDTEPVWAPEGRTLAYVSDRSGVPQLWVADSTLASVQVTRFLGGANSPAWLNEPGHLLFTGMAESRYGIYRTRLEALGDTVAAPPPERTLEPHWTWNVGADSLIARRRSYRPHYSLDLAAGGFGFDSGQGVGQGLQVLFSDQLGDHLFLLSVGNTAQEFGDFLSRLNAGVTYWNLRNRLNTGASVFHFAGDFLDEAGFRYFERRAGVTVNASYPFSRFSRVTANSGFLYSNRNADSFRPGRTGWLAVNYLTFTRDNTLWIGTGPIDGGRYQLTVGVNADLERVQVENVQGLLDLRRYFRLGRRSAYAVRAQAWASEGSLSQRFVLGGSWSFRGYPRRSIVGTRSLLLNQELRFPVMRGAILGLPIGNIGFPEIQGALFLDVGQAWNDTLTPEDWLGSYGVSFRTGLGLLVLRLDFAKLTDFHGARPGVETEFFVGFNY